MPRLDGALPEVADAPAPPAAPDQSGVCGAVARPAGSPSSSAGLRVEHVVSGQMEHFLSLDELLALICRVLAGACRPPAGGPGAHRGRPPRCGPAGGRGRPERLYAVHPRLAGRVHRALDLQHPRHGLAVRHRADAGHVGGRLRSPGWRRTTKTQAGDFLVTPPGWTGPVPDVSVRIGVLTPYVWIIGRTKTRRPGGRRRRPQDSGRAPSAHRPVESCRPATTSLGERGRNVRHHFWRDSPGDCSRLGGKDVQT